MTNRKILFEQLHWNWRSRGNSNYNASLATVCALWCPRCWFFVVSCFSACHVALWLWSSTSVRFVFCSFLITWLLTHSASFSLFCYWRSQADIDTEDLLSLLWIHRSPMKICDLYNSPQLFMVQNYLLFK